MSQFLIHGENGVKFMLSKLYLQSILLPLFLSFSEFFSCFVKHISSHFMFEDPSNVKPLVPIASTWGSKIKVNFLCIIIQQSILLQFYRPMILTYFIAGKISCQNISQWKNWQLKLLKRFVLYLACPQQYLMVKVT